jgi:hypothetical protein
MHDQTKFGLLPLVDTIYYCFVITARRREKYSLSDPTRVKRSCESVLSAELYRFTMHRLA